MRFILIFGLATIAFAQPSRGRAGSPSLPNTQWVKLFNGVDLTGWEPVGVEKWIVKDGVIHGYAVTNAYGYLQTAKDYKNFQLSLRFQF